jgi:hypothetical protein
VEELWYGRRLDVADAIFAKDGVNPSASVGHASHAVPRGPQASKEHVASWEPLEKALDLKESICHPRSGQRATRVVDLP